MSLIEVHYIPVDQELKNGLHKLHDRHGRDTSDKQSVRNGTQISFLMDLPIRDAITAYLREPWTFSGMWSIRLPKGGFHVEHNHPKGRISGCYYVDVPDESSGRLKINGKEIPVKEGMLVLFPSQMPHGTTVYEGDKPRMTVAFDVVTE